MKKTPVGLIAIDLDGTLLRKDKTISPENVRALMEAQEQGIVVSINTGRMVEDAADLVLRNGLSCAIAGDNGAYIVDAQGRELYSGYIPGEKAVELCQLCYRLGMKLITHFDGYVALHPESMTYTPVSRSETFVCLRGFEEVLRSARNGMRKILAIGEKNDPRLAQLRAEVAARFPELPIVSSAEDNIEIGVEGSGKDTAIRRLCEAYGVEISRAMALGDAGNDLPALQVAGYSVAMGNASEKIKAVCRLETRSNEEDGVAWAVRRWAMGEE